MLTKSVLPLIALTILITPAWAKQACTLSEVERLVQHEKEALAALKHHQVELLKIPHVNGLAIGALQNDEQGVIVLVDRCGPWEKGENSGAVPGEPCPSVSHELEWQVPDRLDGVPVEIRKYNGSKLPIGVAIGEPNPSGWVLPGDPGYAPNAKYCMPVFPNHPLRPEVQAEYDRAVKVVNSEEGRKLWGEEWPREGIPVTMFGATIAKGQVVISVGVDAAVTPELANRLPREMGGFPVIVGRVGPISTLTGVGRLGQGTTRAQTWPRAYRKCGSTSWPKSCRHSIVWARGGPSGTRLRIIR
jgi:hypothetical protein